MAHLELSVAVLKDICENHPGCLTADGFDDALLGVLVGAGRPSVACYDYEKCVEILMERDGMSEDEAEDHMQFNVVDAWVGERTPIFLHDRWADARREAMEK